MMIGRYHLDSELGHGATGTVYRAHLIDDANPVAIKLLASSLAVDPGFRTRFTREATVMEQLSHPNCVKVLEHCENDLDSWIVMEYVHGANLRVVLTAAGTLTPAQACGVLLGALGGLGHAHAAGLVHRDVKPDNVLVDEDGVSKLADFGLAVARAQTSSWRPLEGSPAYMSPEQVQGQAIDARSDLYSAGVVLFELLTGRQPYQADNPLAVLHAQVDSPLPGTDGLPPKIASVALWALAKDPDARPATAEAFAHALQDAADDDLGPGWLAAAGLASTVTGILATQLAQHEQRKSKRGKRRRASIAAAVAAAVAAAAIASLAFAVHSTSPERRAAQITSTPPSTATVTTTQAPATLPGFAESATSTFPTSVVTAAPIQPIVDPCVVGQWYSTSATSFYKEDAGPTDYTTGGAGSVRTIQSDGTETYDETNSTPFVGRASNGRTLVMVFRGTSAGQLTARGGTEIDSAAINTSNLTLSVTIGAEAIANTYLIPASGQATYTCTSNALDEQNADGTTAHWTHRIQP